MTAGQDQPKKAPRKHVTTACVPCRESKIKCDGGTPNCQNCEKKGRDCKYQHGDDKRKVSLRAATELFSARIDQLRQFIHDHGLEPPPMEPEAEAGMNRVLDTLQIPRASIRRRDEREEERVTDQFRGPSSASQVPQNRSFASPCILTELQEPDFAQPSSQTFSMASIPQTSHQEASEEPFTSTSPLGFAIPNAESLDFLYANVHPNEFGERKDLRSEPTTQTLEHWNPQVSDSAIEALREDDVESETGDEGENEMIEQLSSRMGTLKLAGDGHLRYYGPTSNLNLLEVPAVEPKQRPEGRSVRHDGQEVLNHLRIGQTVDQALEDHLIEMYFAWQNPGSYVVDREMYISARSKWRNDSDDTPFYSEVLTNAMCALGAAFETRYHPTFVTFPKSLSEFFADRAKALLEIELDSPCVATVQALVILSSHEAASNRDARGWLYSGMSMRLAFDLGLQMDMTSFVQSGKISTQEAEVRQVAFWGSYVSDHFWGFYLGRPFRMNAGDITIPRPASDLSTAKVETWYPYGMGGSLAWDQNTGFKNPSELISRQFTLLWDMLSPLGHILYGCADISLHELQRRNFQVTEDLFAWKASLAPILQVDLDNFTTPVLPHLLMLHMQYHQIVIFAHRPWVSKNYIQPQNPRQGPGYLHARRTCVESATAIARLLRLYEHHYTFRRVNNQVVAIIFTAALMLIFVTISTTSLSPGRLQKDGDHASMVAHLNVCFRALDALEQSFENAKRTRDFLVNLQRRWQNRMRKNVSSGKRPIDVPSSFSQGQEGLYAEEYSGLRKRSRLDSTAIGQMPASKIPIQPPIVEGQTISELQSNFDFDSLDLNWMQDSDLKFLSDDALPTLPSLQTEEATRTNPDDTIPLWWNSPGGETIRDQP